MFNSTAVHVNTDLAAQLDPGFAGWEEKGRYLLYLDLLVDFLKLITYTVFFTLIVRLHGLPLHTMRDLYLTCRSFLDRVSAVARYHRATRNMELRYKTVTEEELKSGESTCVVCREDMKPATLIGSNRTEMGKRLPCGHRFHLRCLKSWLEKQQTCPICRRSVMDEYPEDIEKRKASELLEQQKLEAENQRKLQRETERLRRGHIQNDNLPVQANHGWRRLFAKTNRPPAIVLPSSIPHRLALPEGAELIPLFDVRDAKEIPLTEDAILQHVVSTLTFDESQALDTDTIKYILLSTERYFVCICNLYRLSFSFTVVIPVAI